MITLASSPLNIQNPQIDLLNILNPLITSGEQNVLINKDKVEGLTGESFENIMGKFLSNTNSEENINENSENPEKLEELLLVNDNDMLAMLDFLNKKEIKLDNAQLSELISPKFQEEVIHDVEEKEEKENIDGVVVVPKIPLVSEKDPEKLVKVKDEKLTKVNVNPLQKNTLNQTENFVKIEDSQKINQFLKNMPNTNTGIYKQSLNTHTPLTQKKDEQVDVSTVTPKSSPIEINKNQLKEIKNIPMNIFAKGENLLKDAKGAKENKELSIMPLAKEPINEPIILQAQEILLPKNIELATKQDSTSKNGIPNQIQISVGPKQEIITAASDYIIQNKANLQLNKPIEIVVEQTPLGKVKFSVEKVEKNEIKVSIQTNNSMANEFLLENKQNLVENLNNQGVKISNLHIELNSSQQFASANSKTAFNQESTFNNIFSEKNTPGLVEKSNISTSFSQEQVQIPSSPMRHVSNNLPNLVQNINGADTYSVGQTFNQTVNRSSPSTNASNNLTSTNTANFSKNIDNSVPYDPSVTQSTSTPQGFYEQARRDTQRRAQLWQYAKNRGY